MARTLLSLALALFVGLSAAYAGDAATAKTGGRAKPAAKPAPKRPAVDAAKAAAAKRAAQRAAALRKLPPMARVAASAKQRAYDAKGKVFQAERDLTQAKMAVITAKQRFKQAKRMATEAEKYAAEAAKRAEAEKKQMYARQKARVQARQKAEAARRKAETQRRAIDAKRKAAGARKTTPERPAVKRPAPRKPAPKKPVTKKPALRKPAAKSAQKRPVAVAGAIGRQGFAVRAPARTPTYYAVPGYWSLRTESVQKELKLSDEQKKKLKQISKSYYAQMRQGPQQDLAKYRDMSPEERRKKYAEIAEKRKQRLDAARKQTEAVLLPEQSEALKTIELRTRAPSLLRSPRVLEKLGLSEEQKEKLRKNQQDLTAKMQRLLHESAQKALQILTPKQLEKLKQQ